MAELAERSPIIIQNSSSPSSRKNLDVRPYDRTTVQGATFNMRGQLYRGHANSTALSHSLVVSALGSESDDLGSSPGRGKALCPWDVREKKMRAPLLGLAKSIYYKTNRFNVIVRTCSMIDQRIRQNRVRKSVKHEAHVATTFCRHL